MIMIRYMMTILNDKIHMYIYAIHPKVCDKNVITVFTYLEHWNTHCLIMGLPINLYCKFIHIVYGLITILWLYLNTMHTLFNILISWVNTLTSPFWKILVLNWLFLELLEEWIAYHFERFLKNCQPQKRIYFPITLYG